jgi:hypothetical protein
MPKYLYYNGTTTKSDHILVSADIFDVASRKITDDPGCGHRIITTVKRRTKPSNY